MFILFFLVFVVTVFTIVIIRPIAVRFKLVDFPNNRKYHIGNIPLVGGLAMFIGVLAGFFFAFNLVDSYFYYFLFLSFFTLIIVGVLDDLRGMSFVIKLFLQIVSASILVLISDVKILSLGDLFSLGPIGLGFFSSFFSIVSIIAVINSLNFSDGIDGSAGSIALVTFSSIAFLTYTFDLSNSLIVAIIFIASTLAFLIFNVGYATNQGFKIFMGDSGSMFLGISIAWLLISLSQGEERAFSPATALWIYAIPLMDSFSILIRRTIKGQSLFLPDRQHLHHLILNKGLTDRQALIIIIILSLLMAFLGIIMESSGVKEAYVFFLFLFVSISYCFSTIFFWRVKNS